MTATPTTRAQEHQRGQGTMPHVPASQTTLQEWGTNVKTLHIMLEKLGYFKKTDINIFYFIFYNLG